MAQILLKSASFIFIIILAYTLKRLGLFSSTDYKIATKILLNVTMPAAVATSFASYKADLSLLLCTLIGFGMNWLVLGLAHLFSRRGDRSSRALWLNSSPGYNIGTFSMPFAQAFLSPAGVVACCLYDTGSAIMCTGGTYALSSGMLGEKGSLSLKEIGKKLLHSTPFMSYSTMLILTLAGIPIPQPLVRFISPAANANAFLAMFMVGLMFDVNIKKDMVKEILGILALRIGTSVAIALACFFLLPFDAEIKLGIAIAMFAPISITSTAYSVKLGADPAEAGCLNSLTIPVSIISIVILLVIFGVL